MKGLFIKDLFLMKNRFKFFLVIIVLAFVMASSLESPGFMIGYLTVLVAISTVGTVSFDEYDNGNAFLFTLPITRRGYVFEKYIFVIASAVIAGLLGAVLSVLVLLFKAPLSLAELFVSLPIILLTATALISFMLPLQLKFGAEKSRIAVIILFVSFSLIGGLLNKFGERFNIDSTKVISAISGLGTDAIALIALLAVAALLCISVALSIKIMNKKEF